MSNERPETAKMGLLTDDEVSEDGVEKALVTTGRDRRALMHAVRTELDQLADTRWPDPYYRDDHQRVALKIQVTTLLAMHADTAIRYAHEHIQDEALQRFVKQRVYEEIQDMYPEWSPDS